MKARETFDEWEWYSKTPKWLDKTSVRTRGLNMANVRMVRASMVKIRVHDFHQNVSTPLGRGEHRVPATTFVVLASLAVQLPTDTCTGVDVVYCPDFHRSIAINQGYTVPAREQLIPIDVVANEKLCILPWFFGRSCPS